MEDHSFCITVTVVEASRHSSLELDAIRLILIPYLLDFPVKGKARMNKMDSSCSVITVLALTIICSCRLQRD